MSETGTCRRQTLLRRPPWHQNASLQPRALHAGSCSPMPKRAPPRLSSLKSGEKGGWAGRRGCSASEAPPPSASALGVRMGVARQAAEGAWPWSRGAAVAATRASASGRCCRGRPARGSHGPPLRGLRRGGGGAWLEGGGPAGAGAGPPLAPSSSACGWRPQSGSVRALLAASASGSLLVTGAMAFAETNPAASSLPNGDCGRPRARPGGNRVTVVLGAQWGDEGKGKVVDLLAQDADIVCRCQVSSDGKPGPASRAQNPDPPSKIRCHLELLSSCYELRRRGEMVGGQRPLTWDLGLRGLSGSGGKCGFRGSLGEMRGAWGPAVFGLRTRAQPQDWGRGGDGIRSEFEEVPPEACSRRGAETNPAASSFSSPSLPRPGETEREWTVPKSPEIQAHRSPTCRPRACRPSPPVHFVDTRATSGLWTVSWPRFFTPFPIC